MASRGEGKNVYRVLVRKPEGKNHLKNQDLDERIRSKSTPWRLVLGRGMDSPGSG
jgi:hypothetical protein